MKNINTRTGFHLPALFTLIIILNFSSACAQNNDHLKNLYWVQQQKAIQASTVLLTNFSGLVPLRDLEQQLASINIGTQNAPTFDSTLNKYTVVNHFMISAKGADTNFNRLSDNLKFYKTVIVQIPGSRIQEKKISGFLADIQKSKQLILVIYGDPSWMSQDIQLTTPVIWSISDTPVSADFNAQLIFGGVSASGKLDRTYSAKFHQNDGFNTEVIRMKYSVPEDAGVNVTDLQPAIDAIAADCIHGRAAPGAVVMILKDGKVIFDKAYGYHMYDTREPEKVTDIFDLASVTKITATTMSVMRLYEQRKIDLDSSYGSYIPSARNTNKAGLKIRDILLHQSGLQPDVDLPLQPDDISTDSSYAYPLKAGDRTFIRRDYFSQVIWPRMLNATLNTKGRYVYSDLSMIYMKEVVERQSLEKIDDYVIRQFYAPLGMQTAGYNPLRRFDVSRIVPTEYETDFRNELLRGYVHDPAAARFGGVAGHAGMFASANDLAILYQMILNRGTYGGVQYFKPETVDLFTSKQSDVSRRGLGFDRYDPDSKTGYPSKLATPATYGHTGFTGTCFWVDPTYHLVYVFLSNRVYPKVSDNLSRLQIRGRILDAIYTAIRKGENGAALK